MANPTAFIAICAYTCSILLHAPPGVHPTRAVLRPLMKTQLAVERKSTKEAKAIATEEKKSAMAACKADIVLKQQQRLINSIEVKAAKATTKADKLRLQLATTASAGPPPPAATSPSHKKVKGAPGSHLPHQYSQHPPSSLPRGR